METLNITQQTLRGLMVSIIAAVPGIDRAMLAQSLTTFAAHPGITEEARVMLNDLAAGATAFVLGPPDRH